MLGLEIIKQAIGDNAAQPAVSQNILKKIALSNLEFDIETYNIRSIIERINSSTLQQDVKGQLIEYFSNSLDKLCLNIKKELEDLFGKEETINNKQASVEVDDDKEKKNEFAQDNTEDENKTPAEHVIEQKPAQINFNY